MQETMILLTSRPYIKNSAALCSLREKKSPLQLNAERSATAKL